MSKDFNLPIKTGEARKLDTGAQRDNSKGKGRCDLLPLKIVSRVMEDEVTKEIGMFMETKDDKHLIYAIRKSLDTLEQFNNSLAYMMLEVSKLYEKGAEAYGENNWKRGMPLKWYIDSGTRHYLKAINGDDDEPHHCGFVWNLLGALWTIENVEGALDKLYIVE